MPFGMALGYLEYNRTVRSTAGAHLASGIFARQFDARFPELSPLLPAVLIPEMLASPEHLWQCNFQQLHTLLPPLTFLHTTLPREHFTQKTVNLTCADVFLQLFHPARKEFEI